LEKKAFLLLPADTDQRLGSIVWTSTQNWVRLYSCPLSSSICCSAINAIHFRMNMQLWQLKRASHPF